MNRTTSLILILLAVMATACARPTRDAVGPAFDDRFGDAVRHTVRAQTYQAGDEVPLLHGDRAAAAMRAYRLGDGSEASSGAIGVEVGGSDGATQPLSAE